MELRQLTYFDAVVRHGGFTRAAEHLHIAQPAISAQIRRLEGELGVALLLRTTRRVQLTHAGELLLSRARRILDEIDGARTDLDDLSEVLRGRVRIGAVEALGPFDLHGALATFHARYPAVTLTLRSAPVGQELLDALDAGDIDFALAPTRADLADRYVVRELFTEELVLITAPQHRYSRRGPLTITDLRDEAFVSFPQPSGLRRILDDATGTAGFTPNVPFETTSLERIRGLVSAGLGVALLARSIADAPGPPVTIHSLAPDPIHRSVGLIHRSDRDLTPAAAGAASLMA
ncbi:MAG: LysR family transcriptional regulator [Solirubrobacteraceae bacterium]